MKHTYTNKQREFNNNSKLKSNNYKLVNNKNHHMKLRDQT